MRVGLSEFFRPFSLPFFLLGIWFTVTGSFYLDLLRSTCIGQYIASLHFDDIVNFSSVCVGDVTLDTYVDPK